MTDTRKRQDLEIEAFLTNYPKTCAPASLFRRISKLNTAHNARRGDLGFRAASSLRYFGRVPLTVRRTRSHNRNPDLVSQFSFCESKRYAYITMKSWVGTGRDSCRPMAIDLHGGSDKGSLREKPPGTVWDNFRICPSMAPTRRCGPNDRFLMFS